MTVLFLGYLHGDSKSKVEQVEIWGIFSGTPTIRDLKLFNYVASIDYQNSEKSKAVLWLKNNFSNDGAKTTIGGVNFKISTKSPTRRLLVITVDN